MPAGPIDPFLGRKLIATDIGAWTPNTNVSKSVFGVPANSPKLRILGVSFAALTVPLDADGTMLLQVINNDISEGASDNLVTNFDAETMTPASKTFTAALAAETVENELTLEPGDFVTVRMDNNSAAIDTNPSVRCMIEYAVLPTDNTSTWPIT